MTKRWTFAAALFGLALTAAPVAAAPISSSPPVQGRGLLLVPLTLVKVDDLDFGTLIPSGLSGSVAINAFTGNRTTAGGVTGNPSDIGRRAYFAGAGSPNQLVIVTVTPPAALTSVAGDTIPVLALTLDGPPVRTVDPATRAFYFGVGGVLFINPNQPEGVYQSTFDVTATYL